MRNILITVCLFTALVLQGCNPASKEPTPPPSESFSTTGNSGLEENIKVKSTTPTIGMLNYFSALEEGNIEEVKLCLSKESLTGTTDDALRQLASETKGMKTNFRVHMETIKGDVSKVQYLYNNINDEEIIKDTLYLLLENDEWKVSLKTPNPNPFKKK